MAYILNAEERDIANLVRTFMEREIQPYVAEYDRNGEYPAELYQKAFDMGIQMIAIPEEFGGFGFSTVAVCAILEEMTRIDAGFGTSLSAINLGILPILRHGNDEQKRHVAEVVGAGNFA